MYGAATSLKFIVREVAEYEEELKVCSYSFEKQKVVYSRIVSVARSVTNCYCKLTFGTRSGQEIVCTPTQEFYVAAASAWKIACELRPGDELLTVHGTTVSLKDIQFVEQQLQVYAIEVADTHIFAVGTDKILTHNIPLPGMVVSLTIPWGATAGGAAGSFFGPPTIVVGLIIGGIFGLAWTAMSPRQVPEYHLAFDPNGIRNEYFYKYCDPSTGNAVKGTDGCGEPKKPASLEDVLRCGRWPQEAALGCGGRWVHSPDLARFNEQQQPVAHIPHIPVKPDEGKAQPIVQPVSEPQQPTAQPSVEPQKPVRTQEEVLADILAYTKPGNETNGKTTQHLKPGAYGDALQDFEKLNPDGVCDIPEGKRGVLADGSNVNVRWKSDHGSPTLEIQHANSRRRTKVRYGNE